MAEQSLYGIESYRAYASAAIGGLLAAARTDSLANTYSPASLARRAHEYAEAMASRERTSPSVAAREVFEAAIAMVENGSAVRRAGGDIEATVDPGDLEVLFERVARYRLLERRGTAAEGGR